MILIWRLHKKIAKLNYAIIYPFILQVWVSVVLQESLTFTECADFACIQVCRFFHATRIYVVAELRIPLLTLAFAAILMIYMLDNDKSRSVYTV